jgi:hypothetical protein
VRGVTGRMHPSQHVLVVFPAVQKCSIRTKFLYLGATVHGRIADSMVFLEERVVVVVVERNVTDVGFHLP